ncbi:MAG: hypothetical protein ACTTJ3_09560 [Treponema sp.]
MNLSDSEKEYLTDLLKLKIKSYNLQIQSEKIKKSRVTPDNYSDMFIEEIEKDIIELKGKQRLANSILKKVKKLNEVSV